MYLMFTDIETRYLNEDIEGNFSEIDIPEEFFQELFNLDFGLEDHNETPKSLVYIAAVRKAVKPGCTFTDPLLINETMDNIEEGPVYKLLQKYSIPSRVHILEAGDLGVHPTYFLWSDDSRINQLSDISNEYEDVREWENENNPAWAQFLGVPEEDIEWWKDEGYDSLGDLFEAYDGDKVVVESNRAYHHRDLFHFTPHVARLNKDGLRRQLKQTRKYIDAYTSVCEENNIDYDVIGHWREPRNWTIERE